jgi:hypothetical protein
LSHWYSLVPTFNTSTKDFYLAVEKELKVRQVPGLEISRVEFAEGGVLSARREYLRMARERLVFDICAAPFGTAFFFSCRFAQIPAVIRLWQLLVLVGMTYVYFSVSVYFLGFIHSLIVLSATCLFLILFFRNAVALGLKDLDAHLIKSPVLGAIYENWIRKETYYREDTRLMYLDTVNAVVKSLVEETTGVKGIKLVQFNEYNPVLGELYKPSTIVLKPRQSP